MPVCPVSHLTLLQETLERHYIRRTLQVSLASAAARTVQHFQYASWPDKGAPNETAPFLGFRDRVRHDQRWFHKERIDMCAYRHATRKWLRRRAGLWWCTAVLVLAAPDRTSPLTSSLRSTRASHGWTCSRLCRSCGSSDATWFRLPCSTSTCTKCLSTPYRARCVCQMLTCVHT